MRNAALSVAVLVLAVISVFAMTGCGGGDSGTSIAPSDNEIGPEGGTVTDGGGASVYIPPGALSSPTTISVQTIVGDDDLPSEIDSYILEFAGGGLFEPHGLVFDDSVTITLPLDSIMTQGDTLALFTWSDSDTAWEWTPTPAIVDPGGLSASAKVTHFSYHTVDVSFGGDVFNDFDWTADPGAEFTSIRWRFLEQCYSPGIRRLPSNVGCCFRVNYITFTMEYCDGESMTPYVTDIGTPGDDVRHERITAHREGPVPGSYISWDIVVHMAHSAPSLSISSYDNLLRIDEGETSTMIYGTFNCSDRFPDDGGLLEFTVDGPGSVAPSRISSSDNWRVRFQSTEEGRATVTATLASCMNPEGRVSETAVIDCRKNQWYAVIDFNFTHSGDGVDWTFEDHVQIIAPFTINEEADSAVTGVAEEIDGIHEVTVTPESCDLNGVAAPAFEGGYLKGTKTGNVIQFRYAPAPTSFLVMFGLHCERDPDPPFDIYITAYTNMLATIIGDVVFTTLLEPNIPVTGSGSQAFGDDPPIEYTYQMSLGN